MIQYISLLLWVVHTIVDKTTNLQTRLIVNHDGVPNGMINENSIVNTPNAKNILLLSLVDNSIICEGPSGSHILNSPNYKPFNLSIADLSVTK